MNIEQEAKTYRQDIGKEFDNNLSKAFKETEQFIIKNLHNSDERDSSLRGLRRHVLGVYSVKIGTVSGNYLPARASLACDS